MIIVNTFGQFQISDGIHSMNEDDIRSAMVTKLLLYFLLNKDRAITVEELCGALWQEDETDNPGGALKNLVYRLRTILKKEFADLEFVHNNRGIYRWNQELEVYMDADEFEELCNEGKDTSKSLTARISAYENAFDLYNGEFTQSVMDCGWAITKSFYYHSLFISSVKDLSAIYMDEGMLDRLEKICIKALEIDNIDEELYCNLIKAYLGLGKPKLAMSTYEKGCDVLRKELGIRKPPLLSQIYNEIIGFGGESDSTNIQNLMDDMEEEEGNGVFFCGYPVFQAIFQLEIRKSRRLSIPEHVVLFSFDLDGETIDSLDAKNKYRINLAMEKLELIISKSLRVGDVASKCTASQFIVLLPNCKYENALLISERVRASFLEENKTLKDLKIKVSIDEVAADTKLEVL